MATPPKYEVRRGKTGTLVSRHRTIDSAEKAMLRYLRRVARKGDTPEIFTIGNPLVYPKYGAQVRVGYLVDEQGRERATPWAGIFREPTVMERKYRTVGPRRRRRSTKRNRRSSRRRRG